MPEETVRVGNRDYQIACEPGEERLLQAAARLLDAEASAVTDQGGRLPEARMLLMAGLMLADKFGGLDTALRERDTRIRELEREMSDLRQAPERVEVPAIPDEVLDTMAELAAKAESVADLVADKTRRD